MLQRERKKRVEAMEAFDAAGREEQADREEFELDVIEEFMPEQLSENELEEIVDDVIARGGGHLHPRPRARDGRPDAPGVGPCGRLGGQPARTREAGLSDCPLDEALQALAQTGLAYAEARTIGSGSRQCAHRCGDGRGGGRRGPRGAPGPLRR